MALDFSGSAFQYKSIFEYESRGFGRSTHKRYKGTFLERAIQTSIIFFAFFLISVSAPISLWFCLKNIKHYERIVIFRLGTLRGVKGPGWTIVLPILDRTFRVNLETQAFSVPPQQVITNDGAIVELGAEIQYSVSDALHHVMNIIQPRENIRVLGRTAVLNAAMKRCQSDLERNKPYICREICSSLNSVVADWGLEVTQVELCGVKVLREPEPVNPISQIMNCLSPSGGSVGPANLLMPALAQGTKTAKTLTGSEGKIKELLGGVLSQSTSSGLEGVIKLELIGDKPVSFYVSSQGVSTWSSIEADVVVGMSEEVFYKIFNGILSPLQAYLNGNITVQGDVKKIMQLELILNKQSSSKVMQV